ncbi:HAMP domain-containing protein [Oryzomonas japonica]|uniref:histidine kinase n=1 Tax=Oryzomonas japonica TaxID=2603858 RepID=A0A7J4ZNN1_9BACT|nr:ATP-binding protein [Oryzomonas japonica]KAB0664110.1 HAMP domain-containing protein [Oryzomonas japonica]
MKIRITYRLFLVILAAAILTVLSTFFIMQWSVEQGFRRYMHNVEQTQFARLAVRLESGYAAQGGWDYLKKEPEQWLRLIAETFPQGHPRPPEGQPQGGPRTGEHDREPRPLLPPPMGHPPREIGRMFLLLDGNKQPVFAPAEIPADTTLKPLQYRTRTVGYLGLLPHKRFPDDFQRRFLKDVQSALSLIAGTIVLLAAGLALPLANRLVRPIKALAAATDRLASGEYATRVPITSTDELGQLARGFNSLALTLEKNEQTRRQWVADISHELRTPLAILRGEIEAIQDGIRPANPDGIDSLHGEVLRLEHLVNDLYQLSLSDVGALTYRKVELELGALLTGVLATYRPQFAARGITVAATIPGEGKEVVFGDPERMRQLFANIFDNTLKYTDPGGTIAVRLTYQPELAAIDIEDSAPGVPPGDLERLFERLYRVEASRNRAAGGAGLGLAICRNIVEAHAGTITAHPSALGGIWIRIELPLTGRC